MDGFGAVFTHQPQLPKTALWDATKKKLAIMKWTISTDVDRSAIIANKTISWDANKTIPGTGFTPLLLCFSIVLGGFDGF